MSRIDIHNYEAFLLDYFEGNLNEELTAELKAFTMAHPELDIDLDDIDLPVFAKEDISFDDKETLLKKEDEFFNEELLNYIERNLSPEQLAQFELKIAGDSNLAKEVEAFRKTILPVDSTETLENKNSLPKSEDELILSNRAIAYYEKELPLKERLEFQSELPFNSELRKEVELIQKTKLVADTTIVYPSKEGLKKKETKVIALFSFRNVASIAAALLLLVGLSIVFYNINSNKTDSNGIAKNNGHDTLNPSNKKEQKQFEEKEIAPQQNQNIASVNSSSNPNSPNTNSTVKKQENNSLEKNANREEKNMANNAPQNNNNSNTNNNVPNIIEIPKDTTTRLANNVIENKNQNNPSVNTNNLPQVTRYTNTNLLAVASDDEDADNKPQKKSFWKRAVKVAKQANGLGLKAIKGDEKNGNDYLLSFNSISIEKK